MTRSSSARPWPARSLAALLLLLGSAPAATADTTANAGGSAFEELDVSALVCGTGGSTTCPRGQALRLSGEGLAATRKVTFLGGPGARDDRSARPQQRSPHRVLVAVPSAARSGPVEIQTPTATTTGPRLRVLAPGAEPAAAPPPAPAAQSTAPVVGGGVFPISGKHDYGTAVNRFGGGRGHQGQDVFAACGTPLVAAQAGTVLISKFQSRAGNYVVIDAGGASQAYMHLVGPATVVEGQRVTAGQAIGQVGQTGRAEGCQLHFETWKGGWQTGGSPLDPLPALRRWDTTPEA